MSKTLIVPPRTLDDFKKIISIPIKKFDELNASLNTDINAVDPANVTAIYTAVLGGENGDALFGQVMALTFFGIEKNLPKADALHKLTDGLQKHTDWYKANGDAWTERNSKLLTLLDNPSTYLAASAIDIVNSVANLAETINITPIIKPVIENENSSIQGRIVYSSLFLKFSDGGVSRALELALDYQDLHRLKLLADAAIAKIDILKNRAEGKKTYVIGNGEVE